MITSAKRCVSRLLSRYCRATHSPKLRAENTYHLWGGRWLCFMLRASSSALHSLPFQRPVC